MIFSLLKFWQPKRTRKKRVPIQAASAEEAIYKVIHERKISNKINYDVLNDLKCQSGLQPATPVDSQPPPTPLQTEDLSEASRSGLHFFYFHKCDLLLKVHVLKKNQLALHWEITGQFSWRKNVKSKNSLQRYNYKCNIHFLFLRMVESNGSHIARDIKVLLFSIIIMQENNHIFFFYFKKFMHPFLRINFIKFRNTCNTITTSCTYEVRYAIVHSKH